MRLIGIAVILSLVLAPLGGEAQQTTRRPLVGFLCNTTKLAPAFGDGLRELGYVDGKNIFVEYRCAEGRTDHGQQLAASLLKLKPDVLVAASDPLVKVLFDATRSIPIVMTSSGDPVGSRFIASFARPGGNVTGLTIFASELAGKRLELLKMVAPEGAPMAVLMNPANPNASRQIKEIEAAALSMGVGLKLLRVPSTTELDKAFSGTGASTGHRSLHLQRRIFLRRAAPYRRYRPREPNAGHGLCARVCRGRHPYGLWTEPR